MKKFLMITALLCVTSFPSLSHAASAGTPITDEIAKKYFDNCVMGAQKEGTMTPENQQRYCACTSLNMKQSMTQEDLAALSAQGDVARAALNKVLTHVNGPCMQYPTHDLLHKKCMIDLKRADICSCVSNKMANFMKDISGRMLPQILASNPNVFDPMTPIMETPEFVKTEKEIALGCATNPNN